MAVWDICGIRLSASIVILLEGRVPLVLLAFLLYFSLNITTVTTRITQPKEFDVFKSESPKFLSFKKKLDFEDYLNWR